MFNKQFSLPKKLTPETDITPNLSFYTPSQESISPYCSLYISHSTDKEYLDISHKLLWLVSNFIILVTFSDSVRRNELLPLLGVKGLIVFKQLWHFAHFQTLFNNLKELQKSMQKAWKCHF